MQIYQVENKRAFLSLLLLADEQEDMIDRYIDIGNMYVLDDNGVKAEVLVCDEGNGFIEIKNIAVLPKFQHLGYGRKLVEFVCEHYKGNYHTLQVGTGESPLTVPFYEKCGFKRSHIIKDFFIENYNHPIYECGTQLIDMVYFVKELI